MALAAEHPDSFFISLRPVLVLGQLIGVLPLSGISGFSHTTLKFSWKKWKFLYAVIILATTTFFDLTSTIENLGDGIRLDNFASTIFYTVCVLNCVFFVEIAQQLPGLCGKVAKVEVALAEYGHPTSINSRIKIFVGTMLALSVFEHSLLTYLSVRGAIQELERSNRTFLESFFAMRFPAVLGYIGHNDWAIIYIFLVNVICTLNWNYLDFFLASISMEISGKFVQINSAVQQSLNQADNSAFWRKLSGDYNQLSVLTKILDRKISKLVFMSYVSNLYHLSLQLLRSFKFKGDSYAMAYFYFSMGYLILRMMAVSICLANIREESQASKSFLFALKNPCESARRLLDQVIHDDIHITGKRFFTVDRRFIVTVIGTLITYEIILFQLNSLRYQNTF